MRARGSGLRSSSCLMRSHVMHARCERRPSHLRQTRTTCSLEVFERFEVPGDPVVPEVPSQLLRERLLLLSIGWCRWSRHHLGDSLEAPLLKRSRAVFRFTTHLPLRDKPQ